MSATLPRTEKFLLLLGVLISLGSGYLFFVKSEEFARFLGLVSGTTRDVVAKVEVVHDLVKRKTIDSPEFQDVAVKQNIFSKDTIMTGTASGVVLAFVDGSVVELGPDTLIQIDTRAGGTHTDFELLLDVQKGQVTGTSSTKQIQVKQNGEVKTIQPVAKQSLASFLTTPEKKEVHSRCNIRSTRVLPPSPDADQLPSIEVEVGCGPGITKSDLLVKNSKGVLISTVPIEISPTYTGKIDFMATGPGLYSLELKQEKPETVSVQVPQEFEMLSWAQEDLRCDHGVQWVPSQFRVKGYLLVDQTGKVIRQTSRANEDHFAAINELTLPVQLMLRTNLAGSDFWIRSRVRPLQEWRLCPLLKLPADGERLQYGEQEDILFTWNFLGHEDAFLLEVATDKEFRNKVVSETTLQNFIRASIPRKGHFFWRVEETHRQIYSDKFEFSLD